MAAYTTACCSHSIKSLRQKKTWCQIRPQMEMTYWGQGYWTNLRSELSLTKVAFMNTQKKLFGYLADLLTHQNKLAWHFGSHPNSGPDILWWFSFVTAQFRFLQKSLSAEVCKQSIINQFLFQQYLWEKQEITAALYLGYSIAYGAKMGMQWLKIHTLILSFQIELIQFWFQIL